VAQRITLLESVREQLAIRANCERLQAERQTREAPIVGNESSFAQLWTRRRKVRG
jgi:hypothetical protein